MIVGIEAKLVDTAQQPRQFCGQIIADKLFYRTQNGVDVEAQHAGIVVHSWRSGKLAGHVYVGLCLLLTAEKELQPSLGRLPHLRRTCLSLAHNLPGKLAHLHRFALLNIAHVELSLSVPLLVGCIHGFLGIVHIVLQQEWQHGRVGIAFVFSTDGSTGTTIVVLRHEAFPVAHLCKHHAGAVALACMQQRSGIDVLHHFLIDGIDVAAGGLLPKPDVFAMQT